MGFREDYFDESDESTIKALLNSDHPYLKGITYRRLVKTGWLPLNLPKGKVPFAKGNFSTPSGKCEFYSQSLKDKGLDPLPIYRAVNEATIDHPLTWLTPKATNYFLNSSHGNLKRHLQQEGEPRVCLNPEDADTRGITPFRVIDLGFHYQFLNVLQDVDYIFPGKKHASV